MQSLGKTLARCADGGMNQTLIRRWALQERTPGGQVCARTDRLLFPPETPPPWPASTWRQGGSEGSLAPRRLEGSLAPRSLRAKNQ